MSEEATASLYKALVGFQAECTNVAPNQTADTGQFTYEYADLPAILAELKPKLKKHGLAILQLPTEEGISSVGVQTIILHESGEMFDCGIVRLPIAKATPQGAGSCISYARRYALSAIALVATERDPDAADHEGRQPPQQSTDPRPSYRQKGGTLEGAGSAFDQPMNFGKKFMDRTWREMTEGSINGDRHSYLIWIVGNVDPKKGQQEAEVVDRAQKCLVVIGNRADKEAAARDAEQPEVGDASAF
jgi:hypothetical protein